MPRVTARSSHRVRRRVSRRGRRSSSIARPHIGLARERRSSTTRANTARCSVEATPRSPVRAAHSISRRDKGRCSARDTSRGRCAARTRARRRRRIPRKNARSSTASTRRIGDCAARSARRSGRAWTRSPRCSRRWDRATIRCTLVRWCRRSSAWSVSRARWTAARMATRAHRSRSCAMRPRARRRWRWVSVWRRLSRATHSRWAIRCRRR